MLAVDCCGVSQQARVWQVVPTREGYYREFALWLDCCVKCSRPVAEVYRFESEHSAPQRRRLSSKSVFAYRDSVNVLREYRRPAHACTKRFTLAYSEWGKRRECAQNLGTVRMGRVETDPLYGLGRFGIGR